MTPGDALDTLMRDIGWCTVRKDLLAEMRSQWGDLFRQVAATAHKNALSLNDAMVADKERARIRAEILAERTTAGDYHLTGSQFAGADAQLWDRANALLRDSPAGVSIVGALCDEVERLRKKISDRPDPSLTCGNPTPEEWQLIHAVIRRHQVVDIVPALIAEIQRLQRSCKSMHERWHKLSELVNYPSEPTT